MVAPCSQTLLEASVQGTSPETASPQASGERPQSFHGDRNTSRKGESPARCGCDHRFQPHALGGGAECNGWRSMRLDGSNRSWGSRTSPNPGFTLLVYIYIRHIPRNQDERSSIKSRGSVFHHLILLSRHLYSLFNLAQLVQRTAPRNFTIPPQHKSSSSTCGPLPRSLSSS